jgi:hypothetical protein
VKWSLQSGLAAGAIGLGVLSLAGRVFSRTAGRLRAPGVDYRMTDEDLLWLARATTCESSSHPREHIWAMLQRFVAQQQAGQNWASLGLAVRRFSSPVNDRWLPDGDLALLRPLAQAASPEAQALRRRCMGLTWQDIRSRRPDVYAEIQKVAAGTSVNPIPGYDNFASTASRGGCRDGRDFGGNCFLRNSPPVSGPVRVG